MINAPKDKYLQMDYQTLLKAVIDSVQHAGERLIAEWQRPDVPRGYLDKADVDTEIEL